MFDPRWAARVADTHYSRTFDIEEPTFSQDAHGEMAPASWSVKYPSVVGQFSNTSLSLRALRIQEFRRLDGTVVSEWFTVYLDGYYPDVTTQMRVKDENEVYGILAVSHDSDKRVTYLRVERLNPKGDAA